MKKILTIVIIAIILSCNNKQKSLVFLNKNAYEVPVWEEMLLQNRVKLSDVKIAFKAYSSTHKLSKADYYYYSKKIRKSKSKIDAEGYLVSEQGQFLQLNKYRRASADNTNRSRTISTTSLNEYSRTIPNPFSMGSWKNIGPFGDPEVRWSATGNGAIQYLEMHPTNPAIMYACSRNGGLWKTINYGKNWTPETDHFATNNTSCITINKKNTKVLYLGAAEDQKVWYSSDAGEKWINRSEGLSGKVFDIHSDPENPSRAIVATDKGVFITINAGVNWIEKITGRFTDIDVTNNWDLIVVSKDDNNIAPIFYYTTNKGESFKSQVITSRIEKVDKFYMAIFKPNNGSATQVFAYGIKDSNKPTRFIGLFKSFFNKNSVQGENPFKFTEVKHPKYSYPRGPEPLVGNSEHYTTQNDGYGTINPYSTATWVGDYFVSKTNPNNMVLITCKIWGSHDGGETWEFKPSYGGSNWADVRFITSNITNDTIFWCNDGGIFSLAENDMFPSNELVQASGLTRTRYMDSKVVGKNGDICVTEGSQMDVSLVNKSVFMTGGQDIGQIFVRDGRDTHVASADIYRGRINPNDDSKFITGALLVNLVGSDDSFEVYNNIEPDRFNPDRLYGFTSKNITQKSNVTILVRSSKGRDGWIVNGFKGENKANSGGGRWVPKNNTWEIVSLETAGNIKLNAGTFEQSRANGNVGIIGDETGRKVFITENLNDSRPIWIQLKNAPKANRYRIATHLNDEKVIVLATEKGIYISKDKGDNWKSKGKIPTGQPESVLVDKDGVNGIYVNSKLTVYYIDNKLAQWKEFNKGLPLQNISDMRIAYYANGDSRLYVSKYGRGVWVSPLQSVLVRNNNRPIASFTIHGTSSTDINLGEEVKFVNQSLNFQSIKWIIKKGTDIITITKKLTPKVILNSKGLYDVMLIAYNNYGNDTMVKKQYIKVGPSDPFDPIIFKTSSVQLTKNSRDFTSTFSKAKNIFETGYVYSNFKNDITVNNSYILIAKLNNNKFSANLQNIHKYKSYYFRPYLRDENGIHYGKTNRFSSAFLEVSNMINLGDNKWSIFCKITPQGNIFSNIKIEYGIDNFDKIADLNFKLNSSSSYILNTELETELDKNYKFRILAKGINEVFKSETFKFSTRKNENIPIVNMCSRNKRIISFTINERINSSAGESGYEDFTDVIFKVEQNKNSNFKIISSNTSGENITYSIYIDYNNNGKFDDNERVNTGKTVKSSIITTINFPTENIVTDVPIGMRVMIYSGNGSQDLISGDGEIEDYSIYISTTAITDISGIKNNKLDVLIYPNPVPNTLNIRLKNNTNRVLIEIFDMSGSLVIKRNLYNRNNKVTVNVEKLNTGIYIMKISSDNKFSTIKFNKK